MQGNAHGLDGIHPFLGNPSVCDNGVYFIELRHIGSADQPEFTGICKEDRSEGRLHGSPFGQHFVVMGAGYAKGFVDAGSSHKKFGGPLVLN